MCSAYSRLNPKLDLMVKKNLVHTERAETERPKLTIVYPNTHTVKCDIAVDTALNE